MLKRMLENKLFMAYPAGARIAEGLPSQRAACLNSLGNSV